MHFPLTDIFRPKQRTEKLPKYPNFWYVYMYCMYVKLYLIIKMTLALSTATVDFHKRTVTNTRK
jgi:hypothetical protein